MSYPDRFVWKHARALCRGTVRALGLLVLLACVGCGTSSQVSKSKSSEPPPAPSKAPVAEKSAKKEALGEPRSVSEKPSGDEAKRMSSESAAKKDPKKTRNAPVEVLREKLAEDAVRLASEIGSVRGMKLCHDKKNDEWWLFLYKDDLETVIDVKQFVWNWEREEYSPHTVLKRFPKSKFNEQLRRDEPGQVCREIPVPARGSSTSRERSRYQEKEFSSTPSSKDSPAGGTLK